VIFSTHDLNMAINMADKVWLIMKDGLTEGSPEELMKSGAFENLFESSGPGTIPGSFVRDKGKQDYLKYFL
jgi:ABC-type cobalamin/Fe3+-siderophores transport system ATPase subunit